jgi:hypothetical protein
MLFSFWSGIRNAAARRPRQGQSKNRRLGLEVLEDRAVPSGGPGPTTGGTGSGAPQAALTSGSTSGGTGSGNQNLPGPGYPLAPTTAPTMTPSCGPAQQVTVLVPLSGSPGGPGATLTVAPMIVTVSGSTSGGPAPTL